jgi:hypothetical protein
MERACLEELELEFGAANDDINAALARLELKWDPEKCAPNKLKMKEATLAREVCIRRFECTKLRVVGVLWPWHPRTEG